MNKEKFAIKKLLNRIFEKIETLYFFNIKEHILCK